MPAYNPNNIYTTTTTSAPTIVTSGTTVTTLGGPFTLASSSISTASWTSPYEVRKGNRLEAAVAKLIKTSRLINSEGENNERYHIHEMDISQVLEVFKNVNPVYGNKPRPYFMKLLNAIGGIGKWDATNVKAFVYRRPPVFGHSRQKYCLTTVGYQLLDAMAAKSPRFAMFLKAYDNPKLRKRSEAECLSLLLGIRPASFDDIMAANKARAPALQQRSVHRAMCREAKAIVHGWKGSQFNTSSIPYKTKHKVEWLEDKKRWHVQIYGTGSVIEVSDDLRKAKVL